MAAPRPPYVTFTVEPVEDRTKALGEGVYGFRDVVFAHITVPGQKDTVVKEAKVWLAEVKKRAFDGIIPSDWPLHFTELYNAYIQGLTPPVSGTPIQGWNVLSPGQQQTVVAVGIRSVEDLAEATDEALQRIGPGAVIAKQKAKAWLEQKETGKVVEELVTLRRDNEDLRATVQQLMSGMQEMKAALTTRTKIELAPGVEAQPHEAVPGIPLQIPVPQPEFKGQVTF